MWTLALLVNLNFFCHSPPPGSLVWSLYFNYIMHLLLHYSHLPFPKAKSWAFALVALCSSVGEGEVELPYWSMCGESPWLMVSKVDLTIQLPVVPHIPALSPQHRAPQERMRWWSGSPWLWEGAGGWSLDQPWDILMSYRFKLRIRESKV